MKWSSLRNIFRFDNTQIDGQSYASFSLRWFIIIYNKFWMSNQPIFIRLRTLVGVKNSSAAYYFRKADAEILELTTKFTAFFDVFMFYVINLFIS